MNNLCVMCMPRCMDKFDTSVYILLVRFFFLALKIITCLPAQGRKLYNIQRLLTITSPSLHKLHRVDKVQKVHLCWIRVGPLQFLLRHRMPCLVFLEQVEIPYRRYTSRISPRNLRRIRLRLSYTLSYTPDPPIRVRDLVHTYPIL